jgi:hypothetical protein
MWDVLCRRNYLLGILPALLYIAALSWYAREFYMDDAFIGFRYVSNFISGNGFVFNPAEQVEGVTNIGWLLLLTPFSYLVKVHILAKVVGSLLVVATAGLSYLIAIRMAVSKMDFLFALAVPISIATQSSFAYFSVAGMETAFLSFILCTIIYLILTDKPRPIIAALCAFAYLVHPECIIIFPLAVFFGYLLDRKELGKQFSSSLVFAGLILLFSLLRYIYYDDLVPNTFYAKFTEFDALFRNVHDFLSHSSLINIPGIFSGITGVVFLAAGVIFYARQFRRAAVFMGATVFVGLSFSIYAWQDWTTLPRYFAPYVPLAFILFWKAAGEFLKALFPGSQPRTATALVAGLLLFVIVDSGIGDLYRSIRSDLTDSYPWNVMTGRNLVEPAQWVDRHTPDNSVVATRRIGALSYYSSNNVFDFKYGLTDKRIARLVRENKRTFDNPDDPAIYQAWREKSPDYLLEDLPRLKQVAGRVDGTIESFKIHGIEYRCIKTFTIGKDLEWALCQKSEKAGGP